MKYLFIAYTAEQFHSNADLEALHNIAERATRNAGLPAYWIGCSCMADADELEEDVYRISDVMRGAQDLVIVVGAPAGTGAVTTTQQVLGPSQRPSSYSKCGESECGHCLKLYSALAGVTYWSTLVARI